jgi:2-polyprenyl-3-methyl-5-hydroxy-6-metoxy-1,4-benzoquinol methylase
MSWQTYKVSGEATHHILPDGTPAYAERFDEVLKFHAPGLAPVLHKGAAWHIHPDGSPAYAARFKRTFGYYEGVAAVVAQDGWHHIDTSGAPLYAQRYQWCGNYQSGRCTVRGHDGAYYHLDPLGQPAYARHWRYAGDFRDGMAVVQREDGRSTHIDEQGQPVHGRWFVDLDVFHKSFARACDEQGWMHIDRRGAPLYEQRYASVEPFYNGQARVERFDGGLEVIDERGITQVELRPARRSAFAELSGDMVGFWRTQTIGAAVALGVPEVLPADATRVAQRCGLTPDGAHRILRALGELRLTLVHEGLWTLTPKGRYLLRDHPLTLADAALEYAGPFSQMWSGLSQALTADSGWSAPDIFEQVSQDEARCVAHHRMLQSYARHDYPEVISALKLSAGQHIVDAGGGLGAFATLLLESSPSSTVTVLERPEVVAQGKARPHQSGLRWHVADLFSPWGVEADVVVLARVLHDWDDEAALRILRHAREALSPGGRIFIIEMVIPEGSAAGALCDLHLLMATGGRERSAQEYSQLLEVSGFASIEVRTVAALPSIITGVVA